MQERLIAMVSVGRGGRVGLPRLVLEADATTDETDRERQLEGHVRVDAPQHPPFGLQGQQLLVVPIKERTLDLGMHDVHASPGEPKGPRERTRFREELLGPADRLRFTPRLGVDTIARLSYRAWDRSSCAAGDRADLARHTVVGGTTAFSLEITNSSLRIESLTAPAKRKLAPPWNTPLTGAGLIESGVAIVRLAGPGTWQFSADGSTWRDCKTVYHGRALLLPAEVQIRFVPQPEAKGKASLSLRSWEGDEDDGGGHTNLAARSSVGDGTRFGATIESWSWSFGGA